MVRGLTTFVKRKSHIYLEKYELNNTKLVIDGDAVCYGLFRLHLKPTNACFNGDYDRFADLIRSFFNSLLECNITPYVLYDGGYEDRRMDTIVYRIKNRIETSISMDPATSDENMCFPWCIGETFKDVVLELNIKLVCCDFECDLEAARIADNLNCPLMSSDSDFFIFDVLYIPFETVKLKPITCLRTINNKKTVYKYIACKIFKRDKFLEDIGLAKDMLPLFAVLLGNDYIPHDYFNCLHQQFSGSHHRIINIALFLLNKTSEIAIEHILTICNYKEETDIVHKIKAAMDGYVIKKDTISKYLKYLGLQNFHLNSEKLEETDNIVINFKSNFQDIPLFIDNFRNNMYPWFFMNILLYNTYHVSSQVEDVNMPSAHLINIDIISSIFKILKPSSEQCELYLRVGTQHEKLLIPRCTIALPSFSDLQNQDVNFRQQIFYNVLGVTKSFVDCCVDIFPNSWKLYIISIYYLCRKSTVTWSLIYSLLICKIIIQYVDSKLPEFIRCPELFLNNYEEEIYKIAVKKRASSDLDGRIQSALDNITREDSVLFLNNFLHFFKVKTEMIKNVDLFDRRTVHSIAEFQSSLYHIKSLNSLLNLPFENCKIMSCFNGTFLYNLTCELSKRSTEDYVRDLMEDSPNILNCFNLMVRSLREQININL